MLGGWGDSRIFSVINCMRRVHIPSALRRAWLIPLKGYMPANKRLIIIFSLLVLVMVGFLGCGNQKSKGRDIKQILDNYSDDLSYNFNERLYFMPLPVHQNFYSAFLSFDPSAEYDEDILEVFSPDYVRSNIHEIYCVFLKSEKIPFIIQFPNRKIFDKHLAKLEKEPMVTKNTLKKLLQFEYAVAFADEGIELVSDNFVYIQEDALINGESRYWLFEDYYAYFLGDDFIRDMNVFAAWVTGKKWNDLNATIIRKDGRMSVYTFDPSNNLPVVNDVTKVALINPETNTYITQTGFYIFENPDIEMEIEQIYNNDGSLDIICKKTGPNRPGREMIKGTRVFLSGAVTEIDRNRRVLYSGQ